MKKLARYGAALALSFASILACAADIEFSSESISVADDGTTVYSGNVTIRVPLSTAMKIQASSVREADGVKMLEGDVRIVIEDMLIKAKKATIKRQDVVIIEMDEAESVPAPPASGAG